MHAWGSTYISFYYTTLLLKCIQFTKASKAMNQMLQLHAGKFVMLLSIDYTCSLGHNHKISAKSSYLHNQYSLGYM